MNHRLLGAHLGNGSGRARRSLWTWLLLMLFVTSAAGDDTSSIGPGQGWLVIVGGGSPGSEVTRRFVSLAGGPEANFVVIPTALNEDQLNRYDPTEFALEFGVKNVVVLHSRDRKRADSEDFVQPLVRAQGVWFEGGRQWRLTDAYLGTRTEREIKAVLARGGVVGGTSAGATIQGSYLVRGASATWLNADGDNSIMMAPGHEAGFGLLHDTAIDQHLIVRHRENDLVSVVAAHPRLLGIGIDESTTIVVHGDEFEVLGASKVAIYDGQDHGGRRYYFLSHHQKFDLKKRAVE